MTNILSWHNSQELKDATIAEVQHPINRNLFEEKFGIPKELANLGCSIFDGLPNEMATEWLLKFLAAIPVGVEINELRKAWNHFAIYILIDPNDGVTRFNDSQTIKDVVALHQRVIDGDTPSREEWAAAFDAARDAVRAAVMDAARAAANDTACDAAWYAPWIKQAEKLIEILRKIK